jgi:hypothetical protein
MFVIDVTVLLMDIYSSSFDGLIDNSSVVDM